MDKNLINIDDLVRQRLLGGEERERPGAWLRMSELLEEEMPKRRPVLFIWRRVMGGLAVLLLLSALSLGGYKLTAYRGTGGNKTDAAASQPGTPLATGSGHASAINTTLASENTGAANNDAIPGGYQPNRQPLAANDGASTTTEAGRDLNANTSTNSQTAISTQADNQHKTSAPLAANDNLLNNNQPGKHIHTHNPSHQQSAAANTSSATRETQPGMPYAHSGTIRHIMGKGLSKTTPKNTNSSPSAQGTDDENAISPIDRASRVDGAIAGNHAPHALKHTVKNNNSVQSATGKTASGTAEAGNTGGNKTSVSKAGVRETLAKAGVNNTTQDKTGRGKTGNAKTGVNKTTQARTGVSKTGIAKTGASKTSGEKTGDSKTGDNAGVAAIAGKDSKTKIHKNHTVKVGKGALALGSGTPKTRGLKNTPSRESKVASKNIAPEPQGAQVPVLNNHSNPGGNQAGAAKVKLAGGSVPGSGAGRNKVSGQSKTGDDNHTAATASRKRHVTKKVNITQPSPATGGGTSGEIADKVAEKGQRIIPRLIVHERISSATPGTTNIHMDTVSFGEITEYYDLPEFLKPKNQNFSQKSGAETASNGQAEGDNSSAVSRIKPGKSPSESESSEAKANSASKKTKGAIALENLAAAFNDIKYKAGKAQFQPGIIGGINGNFLGPNSFKGFQFGLMGKLMFSDVLVLMGEFKYFHRINTGYTLDDNYYAYTPVAGGYTKELVQNPYSISTLHSLELPITVRYCIGNFNFFAGGNVVYTFAINTGDYPTTLPSSSQFVQTQGNDNAPKIKANDFNSRIGLGYTLGMSYQLTPKVMLDFRDVQTFWDNSKTVGAKYISSQLYRGPSFQVSIVYRLGGNKKGKE